MDCWAELLLLYVDVPANSVWFRFPPDPRWPIWCERSSTWSFVVGLGVPRWHLLCHISSTVLVCSQPLSPPHVSSSTTSSICEDCCAAAIAALLPSSACFQTFGAKKLENLAAIKRAKEVILHDCPTPGRLQTSRLPGHSRGLPPSCGITNAAKYGSKIEPVLRAADPNRHLFFLPARVLYGEGGGRPAAAAASSIPILPSDLYGGRWWTRVQRKHGLPR